MKNTIVIGSPPQTVYNWLINFAEDNELEAKHSFWPWSMKYKGQAWAFRTAAELILRAEQQ
jgi:hypothetical protein